MGNRGRARRWQLEQDRAASWDRLRDEPWSPDANFRAIGGGAPRVQIIRSPSFDPASFWEVCESAGDWLLYRSAVVAPWYPGPLAVRGYDPVAFPADALRSYVRRLTALALPVAPHRSGMAGLDGTLTRLTLFGDLHSRVTFEWWSDPPPGWGPLTDLADEMLAAFAGGPGDPAEPTAAPTP